MAPEAVAAAEAAEVVAGAEAQVDDKGELKKLIAQRDELKRKLREVEPLAAKAKELEQAQMSESQKLAARIAELEPLATKSARMETVVSALLEQELATVPEELRDVVPTALAAEEKLDWLRQAKAKGLFKPVEPEPAAKPTSSPLATKPGQAAAKTVKRTAFEAMPPPAQADFIRSGGRVID